MTLRIRLVLAFAAALWSSGGLAASTTQTIQASGDSVWQIVAQRPASIQARTNLIGPSSLVRLNKPALDTLLGRAPAESAMASTNAVVFSIPKADGTFARFRVADSPILAPELAAAFPEFRTFTGQGIDDPTATARFGWTAAGFHAIVLSGRGTLYVDPYAPGNVEYYVAVNKPDVQRPDDPFICQLPARAESEPVINALPINHGATLRTYRLALAATGEYTAAAGGTKPMALSRMVASVNRVNGIYERELAVRFTLATGTGADPTALIYTTIGVPYTNNNGGAMLGQNQANIDAVVGNANYDFGHVFSTGGGGVAGLGVVCFTGSKARGVTGLPNPTGDGFDVDFVAHEMGHQFGGNHTFNSNSSSCGGNRSTTNAYEVGSGSTIMPYAGICPPEDLQPHSDDYFTVESLNEMTAFITSGFGACAAASATGNTIPTVSAGSSFTIPVSTPFTLTAAGSDANGDTLTYDWEQYNLGAPSFSVATASTDDGSRPIMRSYLPTTSPSRTFPKLTYILNNANTPPPTYGNCLNGFPCLTGEILPTTSRAMTFHVTARDNRAGGGAIATASTTVTSTTSAGPFVVTAPNTAVSVSAGVPLTVSWSVANTDAAPVNATNVTISLSTDGGLTFPTVLLASTPNDGTQSVTVPNATTTQARIKVQGAGNVFFDVSNTNFTINAVVIPPLVFEDDPLTAGSTVVKAVHVNEMRAAIDALRARFGLGAFTWTDSPISVGVTMVQAIHLTEMRSALNAVYVAAAQTPPTYSTTITAFTTVITVADVAELRAAIRALW